MALPPFMQKVEELNEAIRALDYKTVEKILADPDVPVNIDILNVPLPLSVMFDLKNPQMARLFLDCPRVDWLAPSCNRNLLSLERDFGIKYYKSPIRRQKLRGHWADSYFKAGSNDALSQVFDYFYYIPSYFEDEAILDEIYGRIIDEIAKMAKIDDLSPLLFYATECLSAFKAVLKRCPSVDLSTLKHEDGSPLLCNVYSVDVAKFVIELGAVEALGDSNCAPIDHLNDDEEDNVLEINEWMLDRGFDLDFLLEKGFLAVGHYNNTNFLERYGMTEKVFRFCLFNINQLNADGFNAIFAKYPDYKRIFESDLPAHLLAVFVWGESLDKLEGINLDIEAWSEEDFLRFVKNIITRGSRFDHYPMIDKRADLIKKHANNLLHFAANLRFKDRFLKDLIQKYGADPNALIDGKSALFVCAHTNDMENLLKLGADPFIECDGYLFFEREDFGKYYPSSQFLLALYKQGFDLFTKERKSGKSLIDWLNPQTQTSFKILSELLSFPVKKLCKSFFEVLSSEEPSTIAPIDDEGNTLLHYLGSNLGRYCLRYISCSSLHEAKNFAGKNALRCFVENDLEFEIIVYIDTVEDFEIYLAECEEHYGKDFLEKFGPELVWSLCKAQNINAPLLKHLVEQKGIPLDAVIESGRNRSLEQCIVYASLSGGNEELLQFCHDRGLNIEEKLE